MPQQRRKEGKPSGAKVAAIAVILGSGVTAAQMAAALASVLPSVTTSVLTAALALATRSKLAAPAQPGPAVAATLQAESAYRAAYLMAAAGRLQTALDAGSTLTAAVANETRYRELHDFAQANRRAAAEAVDKVVKSSGSPLVGWRAVMDSRTSAECAAANGRNFRASRPPVIGLPGAVHPHCRCRAVKAFPGAGTVDQGLGHLAGQWSKRANART